MTFSYALGALPPSLDMQYGICCWVVFTCSCSLQAGSHAFQQKQSQWAKSWDIGQWANRSKLVRGVAREIIFTSWLCLLTCARPSTLLTTGFFARWWLCSWRHFHSSTVLLRPPMLRTCSQADLVVNCGSNPMGKNKAETIPLLSRFTRSLHTIWGISKVKIPTWVQLICSSPQLSCM